MIDAWNNERGSSLLLVLIGVVVAGLLMGGLFLTTGYTHKMAVTNREQVIAQYDAQGLMSVALNYYYNDPSLFASKFPTNNSCMDASGNPVSATQRPNVCLSIDANGAASLVATGTDGTGLAQLGQQTDKLTESINGYCIGSGNGNGKCKGSGNNGSGNTGNGNNGNGNSSGNGTNNGKGNG